MSSKKRNRNPYVREKSKTYLSMYLSMYFMLDNIFTQQALTRFSNLQGMDSSSTSMTLKEENGVRKVDLKFEIDFQVERDIVNSRSKTPKKTKKPIKTFGIAQTKSHSKEIRAMKDLTCKDEDFCRTLLEKAHWSLDKALNDFYSAQ